MEIVWEIAGLLDDFTGFVSAVALLLSAAAGLLRARKAKAGRTGSPSEQSAAEKEL
jgi:hypothetical protein